MDKLREKGSGGFHGSDIMRGACACAAFRRCCRIIVNVIAHQCCQLNKHAKQYFFTASYDRLKCAFIITRGVLTTGRNHQHIKQDGSYLHTHGFMTQVPFSLWSVSSTYQTLNITCKISSTQQRPKITLINIYRSLFPKQILYIQNNNVYRCFTPSI